MRNTSLKIRLVRGMILLTLGFIWGNSLLDGKQSGEMSGLVVRVLYPAAERIAGLLTGTHPGEGPVLMQEQFTFWVRKLAHFSEYTVLGAETGIHQHLAGSKPDLSVSVFGPAAAAIDETIQRFSKGRSGELRDVLIDSAGYFFGLLLAAMALRFTGRKKTGA